MAEDIETPSLRLLRDAQLELRDGLLSVKKPTASRLDSYKFWCSLYMGRVSKAFLFLREAEQIVESRFLARPAIEMMIKLEAIHHKPDLLYRIAYTELEHDRRWFAVAADHMGKKFDETSHQKKMEKFKRECAKLSPSADLKDKEISLRSLAAIAGIHPYFYDWFYRMYCRFTHGSLRALTGFLDDATTDQDNVIMGFCIFSAIDSIVAIGGAAPNRDVLYQRWEELFSNSMIKE